MLYLTLRLVHITTMATWMGSVLVLPSDIKRSIEAGPEHLPALVQRGELSSKIGATSALITVLTGFALIFQMGGFKAVPVGIHIGMTTGILLFLMGPIFIGRTWDNIMHGIQEKRSKEELMPLAKRYAVMIHVFRLGWLITLGLMVFRSLI